MSRWQEHAYPSACAHAYLPKFANNWQTVHILVGLTSPMHQDTFLVLVASRDAYLPWNPGSLSASEMMQSNGTNSTTIAQICTLIELQKLTANSCAVQLTTSCREARAASAGVLRAGD